MPGAGRPAPPVHHLAPPRAGAPPGRPRPQPWSGGKRTRALSRYPPPGEGGGRGKRRRALSSYVLAYVAGVRLRPSGRPPVAASAASASVFSLLRPPPKGGPGPGLAATAVAGMPRVYIGRLSYQARERDVERFFKGYGKILEVDLKNG